MTNSLRLQDSGDRRHLPAPFWCLAPELPPSLLGQNVILGPPVILCSSPFATDQFSSLQPLEGNKQGTRVDAEHVPADLFDADGNPVSMHGFQLQRFQDEHI